MVQTVKLLFLFISPSLLQTIFCQFVICFAVIISIIIITIKINSIDEHKWDFLVIFSSYLLAQVNKWVANVKLVIPCACMTIINDIHWSNCEGS